MLSAVCRTRGAAADAEFMRKGCAESCKEVGYDAPPTPPPPPEKKKKKKKKAKAAKADEGSGE